MSIIGLSADELVRDLNLTIPIDLNKICENYNIKIVYRDIIKNGKVTLTKKNRLCFEKNEIRVIVKVMKFRISIITVIRKGEDEEC